ncbi:inositol-pentakisphosphate 2-kinase [Crassisporium funariophilum]|nr:inositol-pentakisphosphate 2-kinase [Crassisporium funariophilum]
MADIQHTRPSDWKYVSEGGATIVFSYRGLPHPHFDGTVLRLRKAIVPATESRSRKVSSDLDQTELDFKDEPDDPTIEYQTKCMERLIPPAHLPRLETVRLNRSWLDELVMLQNTVRPEERREKDGIDLNRKKGVLATDLVGGNWLAVEIKPKWAFLPSPAHLSEATKSTKTQTCRFCMHSNLRLQKGQQVGTDYCPLDLFSGDETRIINAIHSLWNAWVASNAAVNNLKVFARGKFVIPSEEEDLERIRDAFSAALVRPLLQTPVLRILSNLQRNLDVLDIEGLSKLWRETESSAPLYRTTFASFFEQTPESSSSAPPATPIGVSSLFLESPEPGISDWIDFLDTYLTKDKSELDHSNPSPENLRYYLLAYLLSATFKDCSVIVRLDFLKPGGTLQSEVTPNSVAVIDLDPKSMDKLRGWEKLDKEIANNYASVQNKVCVDVEWKD